MVNVNEVIKYPLLSEKTYQQMSSGVYTFVVNRKANKVVIRKAIEFIFEVKVLRVNIMNYDKKPAKLGRFKGFKNAIKKAVVTLKEGDKINIFPDEVEAPEEPIKDKKDAKDKKVAEPSDVEKKAAAKIAARAKAKKEQADELAKVKPKAENKAIPSKAKPPAAAKTKVSTNKAASKKPTPNK